MNKKVTQAKPSVIDLFSGAGGTGWGFKKAGFRIVAAVDTDRHAAATYKENLGVDVTLEDLRLLSPARLRKKVGLRRNELDVLAGCPPCQGFTRLRNSKGARDPRNELVHRYTAFVREFRPKYVLFENVLGIAESRHGKPMLERLVKALQRAGYKVRREVLESADFGVPQLRKRVIIIGTRSGYRIRFPRQTHTAPSTTMRSPALRRWRTVKDAIQGMPYLVAGGKNEGGGRYMNHAAAKTGKKVVAFIKRVPRDGGSRVDVARKHWLACHRSHEGHFDTYGRLAWARPSGTITTGCTNPSKGRYVHPSQARGLSFREAAALQSFPNDFVFKGKCIDRQIGNAVPPLLAVAIARALKSEIKRTRSRSAATS